MFFLRAVLYTLNDISHHILDVKASRTYLLRNEAGGRHAGRGVNLEEVDFLAFGDYVIDADDAIATEYVVDGRGELLHALSQLV